MKAMGLGGSLYIKRKKKEAGIMEGLVPSLFKKKHLEYLILTYRIYYFGFISLLPLILLLK